LTVVNENSEHSEHSELSEKKFGIKRRRLR